MYFSRDRGMNLSSFFYCFSISVVVVVGPDAYTFSVNELRLLTILQQIPFVIPFDTRVQVFNSLIHQNRIEEQHGAEFLQSGSTINIRIRRDYLYEDAFEQLSPQNGNSICKISSRMIFFVL